MKFVGSTGNKITKDKSIVISLIMIINKIQEYYIRLFQINLLVAYYHIFLKTFNSEYDEIKVWFTDQNSSQLEIEDRINLTMVIK